MTEMRAFFTAKYAQCQLAISFLTRLPVANIAQPLPQLHQCFWAFSAVGMVIGGLVYGIFACLIIAGVPAMMSSFAAIGSGVLLTGALHEDGFADMLDGFGGGQDAHAKLAIMKDSHIGSYAVIGLIIVIGIKASSLGAVGVTLPLAISVMVIAGAEVHVADELIVLATYNQNHLGVCLVADEPVDYMRTGFLQPVGE